MPLEQDDKKEVGTFDDFFAEAISADVNDDHAGDNANEVNADEGEVQTNDAQNDGGAVAPEKESQEGDANTGGEEDYRTLYEQERQRTKSWEGRLSARDRENNTLKEELEKYKRLVTQKDNEDDSKEDETVKAFLEEFPELAAPIQKLIDKATRKTSKTVVDDIESRVQERIAPIASTVQEVTIEKHLNTIRSAHNDFDALIKSGEVQRWIEEQPEFMKAPLMRVYEQGYANEVVDLLSRYKKDRNISSGPNRQVTEHDDNNNEQKTTTTRRPAPAVKSRHSAPPTRQEKIAEDDFEGAWAAALRMKS